MPPVFFGPMHTPPHQEVSHQFQEALRSWTETCHNAETPGNRKDLHRGKTMFGESNQLII